jgi:hypothetical protein
MRLRKSSISLPVIMFSVACLDERGSLTHYNKEMTSSLEAVKALSAAHHLRVLGAKDVADIDEQEEIHATAMGTRMDKMTNAQHSINSCAGWHRSSLGDHWGLMYDQNFAMGVAMADLGAEIRAHNRTMTSALDLDSKLAEERAYQGRLSTVLDDVNGSHAQMLELLEGFEDRDSMTCSAGSHMH